MENEYGVTLLQVIQKYEIEKIPPEIAKTLAKYLDSRNEEIMRLKAISESSIDDLRKKNDELSLKNLNIEAKEINITTLTQQLETTNSEIAHLENQLTQNESEISTYRKERNDIIDERDQLRTISNRKDGTIERLSSEAKIMEAQLKSAVSAKSDALARLYLIEDREQALEFKEKRIEREKEFLKSDIANLTDNLNRNIAEQLALREEYASVKLQFEIELKQKTEELRTSNATICQLRETNQMLTNQNEENMHKLEDQVNESARLMDQYEKEIDAKTKLAELYKESSNDYHAQANEMTAAMKELKQMFNETTDECGVLETKLKGIEQQHQVDLDAKEELIAQLKQELEIANVLLKTAKDESADDILENSIPSTSVADRRLKSGIRLTEVYTRYYNVLEELQSKDLEYNQLKLDTENIIQELKEKAPQVERQRIEYKKVVAVNEELTQKIDNYIAEKVLIREELQETRSKWECLERENVELKSCQTDLAKQVCHLLHKMEPSTVETTSDQCQSISSDMPANEVISKKLVTFNNIVEMQENNQKLLLLVRDLSTKLEEMEEIQKIIIVESYDAKILEYEKRLQDAERSLADCVKEKQRFQQLYYEIMKDFSNKPLTGDRSLIGRQMEGLDDDVVVISGASTSQNVSNEVSGKKFSEIEQLLEEKKTELQDLKDEFNVYRKGKSGNIKLLNDEINALRIEVRELTVTNLKMSTQENYINEQVKTQQKDVAMYKKQIKTLEERNQTLDKTIGKHEISQKFLKDEVTITMKKLSVAESNGEQLQRERRRLMDLNRSLEVEYQSMNREKLTNNMLQNNLEMIKGSLERLDNEGRTRLEQRLDDTYRECSALRRRLQEEQNHFREEMNAMQLRTEQAVKKMSDEQAQAETLRAKLTQAEEQIQTQNQKINDLSKNIEQTLTTSQFDNHVVDTSSKLKDLELQLKRKNSEIEKFAKQISRTAEKETELRTLASSWEAEATSIKENFDTCKADLQTTRLNETKLKLQIEELQTEIRLQITDTDSSLIEAASEGRAQKELKEALLKISEKDRVLCDLLSECYKFKVDLQTIEHKYSNEMQIHSSDLQALTLCKDELRKCQERIDELEAANYTANENLKASQLEWEKLNKQAADERFELEQKMECLDQQNTALHDQLQAENNKVLSANNDSLNDSIGNSSISNRTLTEEEVKDTSTDKLMKVIKFLRQEKDISVTKVEILKTENSRLLNKFELQRKRLNELNIQLTEAEAPANVANVGSAAKYNELMRKVETLNAMTDSNIHLREERDALVSKVKELTERVTKLEDELFPLQEKNRELLVKYEEQTQISNMLRTNVDHWRKRASDLVERNNKNPEDFKRLQNERENLAKMLTTEKENLRQVNEELNALKTEKMRLEQEVATTNKQLQTTVDERKKIQDELNNLKQTNIRLTQETIEAKSAILKKEDEMKAIQVELASKDAQLTDSKNKGNEQLNSWKAEKTRLEAEVAAANKQLRTTVDEKKEIENELNNVKQTNIRLTQETMKVKSAILKMKDEMKAIQVELSIKDAQLTDSKNKGNEELHSLKTERARLEQEVAAANKRLRTTADEKEKTQIEVNNVKQNNVRLEKEVQDYRRMLAHVHKVYVHKNELTDAKNQITALTEANRKLESELQTCEQRRSDNVSLVAALKRKLLASETKLENELDTEAKERKKLHSSYQETIDRLIRENETLKTRPNHCRQCQQKVSMLTSSETIEKSPSDRACAVNIPTVAASAQQTDTVNPPGGCGIRLATIIPMSSQNATILSNSPTSNTTLVQTSSMHSASHRQDHKTRNNSTTTSSPDLTPRTDYMACTKSALVIKLKMHKDLLNPAESAQESENFAVNTNNIADISPLLPIYSSEVVLEHQGSVSTSSEQVIHQNQAASVSESNSTFITLMDSDNQAPSSNAVAITHDGWEDTFDFKYFDECTSETTEQSLQDVGVDRIDVEPLMPISSIHCHNDEHNYSRCDEATPHEIESRLPDAMNETNVPNFDMEVEIHPDLDVPGLSIIELPEVNSAILSTLRTDSQSDGITLDEIPSVPNVTAHKTVRSTASSIDANVEDNRNVVNIGVSFEGENIFEFEVEESLEGDVPIQISADIAYFPDGEGSTMAAIAQPFTSLNQIAGHQQGPQPHPQLMPQQGAKKARMRGGRFRSNLH